MTSEKLTAPSKYGFFGLNELYSYFKEKIGPHYTANDNIDVILDFSNVIYWDISALLWMVIAFDHFQKKSIKESKKFQFKFLFPQPSNKTDNIKNMSKKDKDLLRSADYLRRWKFFDVLNNLVDNPEICFVDEQKSYINCEPLQYFKKGKSGLGGLFDELISINLVEIRNLVDFRIPQNERVIKKEKVKYCLDEFIDKAVGPILSNKCEIDKDIANMFVTHLLWESLANSLQHPNATIGMFSISKIGNEHLVLAVADNGDPIPETIYEHYLLNCEGREGRMPLNYQRRKFSKELREKIITHATKEGVTRKRFMTKDELENLEMRKDKRRGLEMGMGLTYIRDTATDDFNGNLIVATDGISVRYTTTSKNIDTEPESRDFDFIWPGNLIRIQLPLKERKQ